MDNHKVVRDQYGNFIISDISYELNAPQEIEREPSKVCTHEKNIYSLLQSLTPEIQLFTEWTHISVNIASNVSLIDLASKIRSGRVDLISTASLADINTSDTKADGGTYIKSSKPIIALNPGLLTKVEPDQLMAEQNLEDDQKYASFIDSLRSDPNISAVVNVTKNSQTGAWEADVHLKST